jgi:hypothetical protein
MLYAAQLLGHHPLDPMQEFGFIPYAEEALESLKEAIEEEVLYYITIILSCFIIS